MVAAIHELVANGYRPETRGGAGKCCPEGGSVCDAVGVAFSVGYKTVEGVRREYNAQVRRTKAWVESVLRKPENE